VRLHKDFSGRENEMPGIDSLVEGAEDPEVLGAPEILGTMKSHDPRLR
jgi:hypothetical protein